MTEDTKTLSETLSEKLRNTTEFPMTFAEFELAALALEKATAQIAREGDVGWEARCRMHYSIAYRLRDYAAKHMAR